MHPSPHKTEGVGNAGCRCTRSLACKVESTRVSHHRYSRIHPAFPHAMVLTAYFVLSPVIGLSCHRHRRKFISANLTPASRRQDHTTSPSARQRSRLLAPPASTAPRPNVRDDGQRPSEGRDGESHEVICVGRKQKYFCKWGWTAISLICPTGKSPAR